MSSNIGKVRSIRIFVEPVEVELDEDDGIKWTSLQTAFPGCSGLYFREREKDCRSSVKFDGQKFQPPGGAWNDRQYYVNLSQRCHGSNNLNSYESATKTFEKSVHAVQAMLAASMGGSSRRRAPISPSLEKHSGSSNSVNTENAVNSNVEKVTMLQSANQPRDLTPLEQQFADLAKISTGKDIVIENLRDEIRKLNEKIEDNHKSLREIDVRRSEAESRTSALEMELNMLRSMASGQENMNKKLEFLTKDVAVKEKEISDLQKHIENQEKLWKDTNGDLESRVSAMSRELDLKSTQLNETLKSLELALSSKSVLSREIEHLRPLADAVQLENYEDAKTYAELKKEVEITRKRMDLVETENKELKQSFEVTSTTERTLAIDNTRLIERNTELEDRIAHVDDEIKKINQQWKTTMDSTKKEWGKTRKDAEKEVDSLRSEISKLQRLLETATRDATDNARRLDDSNKNMAKLKKQLEMSEFRQQEPLHQVKTLSLNLHEAENRIVELTGLVASLTSDAHNSRRDMDDLI